jgi:hypothetical protein
MSLTAQFQQALQQPATPAAWPARIEVQDAGQRLTCELTALDGIGCAFRSLVLQTTGLAGADLPRLQRVAAELARRINYLLEPIGPIECDAHGCTVQLRSLPPQRDEQGITYYELLLRGGGTITLQRWQQQRGQPRQAIDAEVTRAVLVRLAGDFAAVASVE